jgi:hypothetical protein
MLEEKLFDFDGAVQEEGKVATNKKKENNTKKSSRPGSVSDL